MRNTNASVNFGVSRRAVRSSIPALLGRGLLAATFSIGVALGSPAVANAERIWDIDKFDKCANNNNLPPDVAGDPELFTEYVRECCDKSGGDWNTTTEVCQAPPAERPPVRQPPVVVTPGQVEDPVTPGTPRPTVPMNPGGSVG